MNITNQQIEDIKDIKGLGDGNMIKKVWKDNRVYFLLFAVMIISLTIMDVVNFRMLPDSGFWSMKPNQFDAWHLFKLVAITSVIVGFIIATWEKDRSFREWTYILVIYVVLIAFAMHEFILHQLF